MVFHTKDFNIPNAKQFLLYSIPILVFHLEEFSCISLDLGSNSILT